MKKLLVLILVAAFTVTLSAQDVNVPKEVKEAFTQKYPNVMNVKWSKENSEEFEAEFTLNGVKTSVVLDEEGDIEETETAVTIGDLSGNVISYVKDNYKGYDITEAAKIVDEDGNVFYEAEISKGESRTDLLFDTAGNPVKKQKEAEDESYDEEDED